VDPATGNLELALAVATGSSLHTGGNFIASIWCGTDEDIISYGGVFTAQEVATPNFISEGELLGLGNIDVFWADSTAHRWKMSINNPTGFTQDVVVGATSADTLVNKTIDTLAPNTIKIHGTSLTAVTGTGAVVLASSPSLTTPNIGSATGSISGNAGTATALAATPSQCTSGQFATGITASGSANCSTPTTGTAHTNHAILTGGSCATTNVAGNVCSGTISLAATEADTNYAVSCTGVSPSNFPLAIWITSKGTTSISYEIVNGTASQAMISSFSEIDCTITR
jgi:hypothetical protein